MFASNFSGHSLTILYILSYRRPNQVPGSAELDAEHL